MGLLFALLGAASDAPPPPPELVVPEAVTHPASIGAPHVCAESRYPIPALQIGAEGNTQMKFTITPEGHVTDMSVMLSSGNPDLDAASLACAREWLYRPAMQNGAAVAAPWLAQVRWKITVTAPFFGIAAASYQCITADPATRAALKQAARYAVVKMHFTNGTFGAIDLVASSGNPDLDRQVLACYQNLPPELAADIPGDTDELFVAMLPPGG
ncbi:MAG TPA: energy transducer TonB [Rhizomicrobium sp.]